MPVFLRFRCSNHDDSVHCAIDTVPNTSQLAMGGGHVFQTGTCTQMQTLHHHHFSDLLPSGKKQCSEFGRFSEFVVA